MAQVSPQKLVSVLNFARQAYGRYRFQILTLVALSFVSGILEGIGINALIPLFSFALGSGEEATDTISRWIERFFVSLGLDFSVKYLLAFIAILFILKAIMSLIIVFVRVRITADYEQKIKTELFEKILAADWPHLLKQKLGHLETILLIDAPSSARLLAEIAGAVTVLMSLLIYAAVAINISLSITLLALAVGAGMFLVFRPLLNRTRYFAQERVNLNKLTAHHINENVLGAKTLKTMTATAGVFEKGRQYFEKQKNMARRAGILKALPSILIQPISVLFLVLIFAYAYRSEAINLAVLAAIVYLTERIFVYVQQLYHSLEVMIDLAPHLRSVVTYQNLARVRREENQGWRPFVFAKELKFQGVDFAYEQGPQILRGVNFTITKGEMVGLIGPSGVGKTTLVDLLLRLLVPTGGQILLDGQDVKDIELRNWRRAIGYVSQDLFLMNDTIRNNIRFYRSAVSDEDIEEAAALANIAEFVKNLPQGFDTVIGERGMMLSAGQRQRVVIARVLARRPEFLVFDEATSALDNESEAQIQQVIDSLRGRITSLIIAHRLSTLNDVDKMIVLEDGTVTEDGSPGELLQKKESYFSRMLNLKEAVNP